MKKTIRRIAIALNFIVFLALILGAGSGRSLRQHSGSVDDAWSSHSVDPVGNNATGGQIGARLTLEPRTDAPDSWDDSYGVYGGHRFALVDVHRNGLAGITAMEAPRGIAVSPDGGSVYVAASSSHALLVFRREPVTGTLTYLGAHQNGLAGVNGMAGAWNVTVSPNGSHVYVTGRLSNAVAYFDREPTTGALTFVDSVFNGSGNISGLSAPSGLVCSSNGASLYVACAASGAVVVFARDTSTGALSWIQTVDDTDLGAGSLDGADGIALDSSDRNVYVAAEYGNSVVGFARDGSTGELTFIDAEIVGEGNVTDPSGPRGVAIALDGESVLVVGISSPSIAVFDRTTGTGMLAFNTAISHGGVHLPRWRRWNASSGHRPDWSSGVPGELLRPIFGIN